MKKWFNSKTVLIFGAVAIVAVALTLENLLNIDLGTGISLQESGGAAGLALVALALRFLTSEGVTL